MVPSLPMLCLAAIAFRFALSINVLYGIFSWMKIATPPCVR